MEKLTPISEEDFNSLTDVQKEHRALQHAAVHGPMGVAARKALEEFERKHPEVKNKRLVIELGQSEIILRPHHTFTNMDIMKVIEVLAHSYITRNGQPMPEFDHELPDTPEDQE